MLFLMFYIFFIFSKFLPLLSDGFFGILMRIEDSLCLTVSSVNIVFKLYAVELSAHAPLAEPF